MKKKDYLIDFLLIFTKLNLLSYLFYYISHKYNLLEYSYLFFIVPITIIYILSFKKSLRLKYHYYSLFQELEEKYGKLKKRDYLCISLILNLDFQDTNEKYDDWIEGHEYLYSSREMNIMRDVWYDLMHEKKERDLESSSS